jgi:hypothetical protein
MNGVHTVSLIRAVIDLGVTSRAADLPRHASEARCPVSQDQGGTRSARTVLDLPRPSEGRRVVPRSCCRWSAAGSRLGPACLLRLRPDVPGCLALWVQRPKGATLRPDPRRECLRSGLLMRGVLHGRRTTPLRRRGRPPPRGMTRRRRGATIGETPRSAGDLVCRADPLTAARVSLLSQKNASLLAAGLTAAIVLLPGPGFIPFIECNSAPALRWL